MREKVIAVMQQYPTRWLSPSRISAATGLRLRAAADVLEELVQDEIVDKMEVERKLDRRLYRWKRVKEHVLGRP